MNKLDKDFLIGKVAASYNKNDEDKGIVPIDPSMVFEFKIGKKYAYRLNSVHSDYEGLRKTHEGLVSEFLSHIPVSMAATAYVPEKSYFDFLEPHKNNYFFVRTDLKNFFHSISREILSKCFEPYFKNEYSNENNRQNLLDAFINLVTYNLPEEAKNKAYSGKCVLPMGFKTSPVISNIIFRKIDFLIEDYCSQHSITYTRYADDMLFSSKTNSEPFDDPFAELFNPKAKPRSCFVHSDRFLDEISFLVRIDGFKINESKTIKATHTISINGYTIEGTNYSDLQGTIRISNKKTHIIEKLLYELKKGTSNKKIMLKLFDFKVSNKYFNYLPVKAEHVERYCEDQISNKIKGYRSYLISILKYNNRYNCVDNRSILKYERLMEALEGQL